MGGTLEEKIKRFESVNRRRKALELEEKQLKEFFKEEAAGQECVFEAGKISVRCVTKQRTGWNSTKLKTFLGSKITQFRSSTDYVEVSVSKAS